MSNDIRTIRLQLNKIKKLVQQEKDQDKRAIKKLSLQLKQINTSVAKLSKMATRIKGGKIRGIKINAKKGGSRKCPFIVEEEVTGGKKRRKKKKTSKK